LLVCLLVEKIIGALSQINVQRNIGHREIQIRPLVPTRLIAVMREQAMADFKAAWGD
jgi:hypothetical protein